MKNSFNIKIANLSTLEQNKVNGKAAERYFAAMLTIALNARVFWATRTEDDSKVDLISVLTHTWYVNRVEAIFTQVKSGETYCSLIHGKLTVEKQQFKNLLNRNHHTLVCWTKKDQDNPYWFLIRANSHYVRTVYNQSHKLSPASRFDIIRIVTSAATKDGGAGLIFSRLNRRCRYSYDSFKLLRRNANSEYKQLHSKNILNPLLGKIEFTRLGWRHMTRESRLNIFKIASYEIIQILGNILAVTPSKHYVLEYKEILSDGFVYRENEYILHYSKIKCFDKEINTIVNVNVYIKILELIGYNEKWREMPVASDVNRRVIFKSIYFKENR